MTSHGVLYESCRNDRRYYDFKLGAVQKEFILRINSKVNYCVAIYAFAPSLCITTIYIPSNGNISACNFVSEARNQRWFQLHYIYIGIPVSIE